MVVQRWRTDEPLSTEIADDWFFACMCANMVLQCLFVLVRLPAHMAAVRLEIRVSLPMDFQPECIETLLAADVAFIFIQDGRSFVKTPMYRERHRVLVGFAAILADERLQWRPQWPRVAVSYETMAHVELFNRKRLAAEFARKDSTTCVTRENKLLSYFNKMSTGIFYRYLIFAIFALLMVASK